MYALIFSDSHGKTYNMQEVIDRQTGAPNAVFFLGDGLHDLDTLESGRAELYCVRGNCDVFAPFEDEEQTVVFDGLRIFMTHGHRYMVKSGFAVAAEKALKKGADILLFGHTHQPICILVRAGEKVGDTVAKKDLWIFNPGSVREGYFGTLTVKNGQVLLNNACV